MNKKDDDFIIQSNNSDNDFDDIGQCGCNLCYTTRNVGEFFMNLMPNNRYFRNQFMFCLCIILFLIMVPFFLRFLLFVFIKLFI